jgi:hypothetical protein
MSLVTARLSLELRAPPQVGLFHPRDREMKRGSGLEDKELLTLTNGRSPQMSEAVQVGPARTAFPLWKSVPSYADRTLTPSKA